MRNQNIVQNLVAEYLPDEEDPEYEKYEASYEDWRAEIEERYPQVCRDCKARVEDQIRNAGYAAKADHLRRLMEKSEQKRRKVQTSRQSWTLRIISLAKWTYLLSFCIQVLWHLVAYMMAIDDHMWDLDAESSFEKSTLDVCFRQAFLVRSVDEGCVFSSDFTKLVLYALIADGLTIWWNPRLEAKTNSISGRMRGLNSLWAIRVAVLVLRSLSVFYWRSIGVNHENLARFQNANIIMLAIMALSLILTWKTVHITYHAPVAFRQSMRDQGSAPNSAEKPRRQTHKVARPQATAFDTMAQGFTSSFLDEQSSVAFPPSPTLTATSYSTHATEATTPYSTRTALEENDMDWTPTRRLFAQHQPTVHPSPWSKRQQTSPQQQAVSQEPHSLFSKPDPNPFRRSVPAAPKAPAAAKVDPWKRPAWDPPLKETMPNFFKEDQKARGGVGETKGLDGFGVPKNVKRDAELFASPKLKYDYYGTMKDTGLEDTFESTFNNFFAK